MALPTMPLTWTGRRDRAPRPAERELLDDLQATILKAHGRNRAAHVFITFNRRRAPRARTLLSRQRQTITSATSQLEAAAEHRRTAQPGRPGTDGGVVRVVLLTAAGFRLLRRERDMPEDPAFRAGMQA